jgi:hypothetical protein
MSTAPGNIRFALIARGFILAGLVAAASLLLVTPAVRADCCRCYLVNPPSGTAATRGD